MKISNILVVIDPTVDSQLSYERAMSVAKETGAELHLFACVYEQSEESVATESRQEELVKQFEAKLETLAQLSAAESVASKVEVIWEQDWYNAIVGCANDNAVDLVVKNFSHNSLMQRKMKETSDWKLIRSCNSPILLVKSSGDWKSSNILAAVETNRSDEEHKRLTDVVLGVGNALFTEHKLNVHFVSAYKDSLKFPDRSYLHNASQVPNDNIHVVQGKTDDVIVETTKKNSVDLLIMGTVARTGIKGMFMGNTVEKVLDKVNCDVLVMNSQYTVERSPHST